MNYSRFWDKFKFNFVKPMRIEVVFAFLFSLVIAFFFSIQSPLHLWVGADTNVDSSVFKTISMMMQKGYMPYRDTFDHKGRFCIS